MNSWRPLLRLAWRDAVRARGRSMLVLVMIALPVLAVTVADIVIATQDIGSTEVVERRIGAADARVSVEGRRAWQAADPERGASMAQGRRDPEFGPGTLAEVLGPDVRAVEQREGQKRVQTDSGVTPAGIMLLDAADPLADGMVRLDEGRLPAAVDEAFVNHALADRGPGLGETLTLVDGTELEIVGVGEDMSYRDFPHVQALPGAIALRDDPAWLVDAGGPVTWEQVRALNQHGAMVLSRSVLMDPPSESELPPRLRNLDPGLDSAVVAVVALVVAMVLLEVVLLAGPAFAVTARRQARTLALMAAAGGTPVQARRAVLATGVVLGAGGAALGVGLGILLAWVAAVPVAQHFSGSWFGPFDVPWLHLLGVAVFGFVAAVLAAAVPAWIAARQDVVAVLAGRRGDSPPSRRSPVLGLALLGAGVAGAAFGALRGAGGEFYIAAAAIVSVLGMVLLLPVVVAVLARVSGRLPLTARYAVRDAARHRTRTVPAVAAVTATVAGVVALGIANASDELEREMTYTPVAAMGDGVLSSHEATPAQWAEIEAIVRRELPDGEIERVAGLSEQGRRWTELTYRVPGSRQGLLTSYGGSFGSNVVADRVPGAVRGLDEEERARADRTLEAGGVVVFASAEVRADEVSVTGRRWGRGRPEWLFDPTTMPATYVQVGDLEASVQAVLPPAVATRLGLETQTVALSVTGTGISRDTQEAVSEATQAVVPYASLYVERGYQQDDAQLIVLWVLGGLGVVLMLGGTLTATSLALSDARPDLATLSAVGAAPRTRRGVAAAYAGFVGSVGAVSGAVVGFVPGVAVTYPLTGGSWASTGIGGEVLPQHYLAVPWLLVLAIVVVLPLVTACVVGLAARSRLPLVARLD